MLNLASIRIPGFTTAFNRFELGCLCFILLTKYTHYYYLRLSRGATLILNTYHIFLLYDESKSHQIPFQSIREYPKGYYPKPQTRFQTINKRRTNLTPTNRKEINKLKENPKRRISELNRQSPWVSFVKVTDYFIVNNIKFKKTNKNVWLFW